MTEQEKIIQLKRTEITTRYTQLLSLATRVCEGVCECHNGCCLPTDTYCAYGSLTKAIKDAKELTDEDILAIIEEENAPYVPEEDE